MTQHLSHFFVAGVVRCVQNCGVEGNKEGNEFVEFYITEKPHSDKAMKLTLFEAC